MSLIIAIPAMLIALVLLVAVVKLNPFLAFIVVSIFGGLALGISSENISKAIQKGIGDMMGSILIVITLPVISFARRPIYLAVGAISVPTKEPICC